MNHDQRLTKNERDALARFDAEALVELDSEGVNSMNPRALFRPGQLAAAASILVMLAGLFPVLSGLIEHAPKHSADPAPSPVVENNAPRRVNFLIGLPLEAGKPSKVRVRARPSLLEKSDTAPSLETFTFDLDAANQQRNNALKKARENAVVTLFETTPYTLRDQNGQELPIHWIPYATGVIAERALATHAEVEKAFEDAAHGRPFDARLVLGGWVYADPEFFDLTKTSLTEESIASAKRSVDQRGNLAVKMSLREEVHQLMLDYTGRYVGARLCLVVDQRTWMDPIVREPIRGDLQITGGAGFNESTADYLIEAMGFSQPAPKRK